MLKRNIVLLFAFATFAGSVCAQVRPGIKLGYNLGGVMADYRGVNTPEKRKTTAGDPENFKMKSGFQAGIIADCPINDVLAIQPGARFSMQGFIDKYTSGESSTSSSKSTRKFSLYYLQLPVYAQYRWNVYEETNVLFQAGPYVGFGLFGRQSYIRNGKQQDLSDAQKKIIFGNGTAKDIQKAIDYGVGVGAGIEFYRFQLMLAYDYGLSKAPFQKDLKSGKCHIDMRNHNFSVTLGVVFGRRDPLQNQKD